MDILFSPYGLGGMPKSAVAEVERRTEELLRSSSFQRMLELEKKHKMERLRGTQTLLPSPPLSGPPPRPERPDAACPQEQFLMVKAARRTVVLPSLSITIPPPTESVRDVRATKGKAEHADEESDDAGTPTNTEPSQKQVKFLAPEGDEEESGDDSIGDGMSEQSSICQSPSWEGYGQRKKDKKREAERRKREKEQAEKEAKAARKRASARLSKPPPPQPVATTNREPTGTGLTSADRSKSDPLLVTRRLIQISQSPHLSQDVGRTTSADDPQDIRRYRPAVAEVVSGQSFHDSARRQLIRRSMSEGPVPVGQQASAVGSFGHDGRSPGDGLPPSASRTPALRHMSPSGGNRAADLHLGTAEINRSRESLSGSHIGDPDHRRGYVGHQRAQVTERAMAGLADEQVARSAAHYYPPSRSSSGQTQHSRRSSLTQEAKAAALKFVGMKTSSAAKENEKNRPTDYLNFKSIPYSAPAPIVSPSAVSLPGSPRSVDGRPPMTDSLCSKKGLSKDAALFERPTTSQSSVSSSEPSVTGSVLSSHAKRGRGFKDAARAALSISKGSHASTNNPKPSLSLPPYLALRSRMQSRAADHTETSTARAAVEVTPKHTEMPSASDPVKAVEMGSQAGYRVSEGSSSSSAYEDGSPLPSPSTTPDTSRPQSAKDVPLSTVDTPRKCAEASELQDDERTLRQSMDSSKSSTPRMADVEARVDIEMGHEDRWSRSALPLDLDFDAQSFMTTFSNFDDADDADHALSTSLQASAAEKDTPEPFKQAATMSLHAGSTEPVISIPPRSRKRGQTTPDRNANAPTTAPFFAGQQEDAGNARTIPGSPREHDDATETRGHSSQRVSRNFARPPDLTRERKDLENSRERNVKHPQNQARAEEAEMEDGGREYVGGTRSRRAPGSPQYDWTSGSTISNSSTVRSAGPTHPHALGPDSQAASSANSADLTESPKYHEFSGEIGISTGPPSPISLPSPLQQVPPKPPTQPRTNSAPTPLTASGATSRASTPSARASGMVPVSILKQPKSPPSDQPRSGTQTSPRPPVLSAIPKHMQLQAGNSVRPPNAVAETRMAPLAKIFVECCSCRFYHDMPSKLYECMAKPDAVVEDRLLGISGNITTMVKCPWCQHNMSRNCCPGYAAVVYLKEKLH